jgi:hypothetical protein
MSDDEPVLAEALERAFDRLGDFRAVWPGAIPPEAIECLQRSVGLEGEARALFAARLRRLEPGAAPGAVLLGVLIGLSAAELAHEG